MADINQKADEAYAAQDAAYETQELNFDTQLYDIITGGIDANKSPVLTSVNTGAGATGVSTGAAIASSLIGVAGKYATDKMSLGLGQTSASKFTSSNDAGSDWSQGILN
jgi:hypothetical protein